MSNKVLITNSQKAVKVPSGLRILIRRACNAVLEYEHFDAPVKIAGWTSLPSCFFFINSTPSNCIKTGS